MRPLALLALLALVPGCAGDKTEHVAEIEVPGVGDPVSDTGFVGSWMRGNELNKSVVMIFHDGERYRFRWQARSQDGHWRVDCDWDGHCEEFDGDRLVANHTLRVSESEGDGRLLVEKTSVRADDPQKSAVYVDEWQVEDGGRALEFLAVRRLDQSFDGSEEARPRGRFDKISDRVADPPPTASGS